MLLALHSSCSSASLALQHGSFVPIIILAMQNVLLEFFQVSHYCLPVGVPVVLLLSKSDTNYGRLHLYFLTHLQISSRADFWYSLCHKHLGNFAFDSDTNSVTNENPHLELKLLPPQNRILIPFRIACAMDRTNPLFKSFFELASKALC